MLCTRIYVEPIETLTSQSTKRLRGEDFTKYRRAFYALTLMDRRLDKEFLGKPDFSVGAVCMAQGLNLIFCGLAPG